MVLTPTEEELRSYVHDLFLNQEYIEWRKALKAFSSGEWHSLIAGLVQYDVPIAALLAFDEEIFSKLVFSYIKAPDYDKSQMLMIQFTVSGSMWTCLVWHCPERN